MEPSLYYESKKDASDFERAEIVENF